MKKTWIVIVAILLLFVLLGQLLDSAIWNRNSDDGRNSDRTPSGTVSNDPVQTRPTDNPPDTFITDISPDSEPTSDTLPQDTEEPAAVLTDHSWSVIGTVCGSAWDTDYPMERVADNVFELSLRLHRGEELKVRMDGSWEVNFGADGLRNGSNLYVQRPGDYTVRLTIFSDEQASLELVELRGQSEWSVIGTLYGSYWDHDYPMLWVADGVYRLDCPGLKGGEELCVRKTGNWDSYFGADGNPYGTTLFVGHGGDYVLWFSVDDEQSVATLELVPCDYTPSPWSVIGTMYGTNWDLDFQMFETMPGTYEAECIAFRSGDELKVRRDGNWGVNYGVDGVRDGANLRVPADGNYTLRLDVDETGTYADLRLIPQPMEPARLRTRVRLLQARLEYEYPVCIRLGEVDNDDQTPATDDSDLLGIYRTLWQIEDFFRKLPEGFVNEICNDVPGAEDWGTRAIQIYIVRDIPGNTVAYACAWDRDMRLCFAINGFGVIGVAHEFMHLFDFRLSHVDPDFMSDWEALTPEWASSSDDAALLDCYYVTDYAHSHPAEDRAEVFMLLFNCSCPLEEAWWYRDRPGVQEKVDFLISALRSAFPSVWYADRVWWEK